MMLKFLCGTILIGVLSGCAAEEPVDCATADIKGYSELTEAMSYCTECHGDRRADSGYRYDTYELAVQGARRGAAEIENGSMPEDADMPEALQLDFRVWATCGTPE